MSARRSDSRPEPGGHEPRGEPQPSAADSWVLFRAVGLASVLLPYRVVLGRVLAGGWAGASLYGRLAVIAALPFAAITVAAGSFSPFLYFQF